MDLTWNCKTIAPIIRSLIVILKKKIAIINQRLYMDFYMSLGYWSTNMYNSVECLFFINGCYLSNEFKS